MNKRIEKLSLLCYEECGDYHIGSNSQFNHQKFAELIVRECAGLAKTKSDFIAEQAMKYAEDTDEETSAKATAWQFLVFGQEIKRHFGVEE